MLGGGEGEGQILFSEYMILFPKQAKVGDMSLCIMIVYFFSDIFPLFSTPISLNFSQIPP